MLALLRQLPYLQNRKYVLSSFRCIYSKRILTVWSNQDFEDPVTKTSKKKPYGEKEISLLKKLDPCTPFPGNIGGLPLWLSYTTQIKKLPKRPGSTWEATIRLPEDKYACVLSQYVHNSVTISFQTAMSLSNDLECVAHKCPILLQRDFSRLFPLRNFDENLTLITLCLKTENDMSIWSEEAEEERERLSNCFITVAEIVTEFLNQRQFWADFVHPTTGKPQSNPLVDDAMFETDLRYRNFGMQIEDLGCCRIISHPIWKTNVFVGAIFTNAPLHSFEIDSIKQKPLSNILKYSKPSYI